MNQETPRRTQARRGFSIAYKGKTLLSVVDPISHAARIVATVPILKQTLYLCPSPLFGYGLRELLDRITADSVILCLEADPALLDLSLHEIIPDIHTDSRIRILRATDGFSVCSYVRREFGPRRFRRVVPVKLNGGYSLSEALYDEIEATLREDIALEWSNAMTLVKLGRRYALNAVRNLALLPCSMPLSAGLFNSDPILVLGAGPSLDSVEGLLKRKRGYRIVCVDTAFLPLLARGIEPDLVVALEAQFWNLRDFIGTAASSSALAHEFSALPRGAFVTRGDRHLFSVTWAPLRLIGRLEAAGLRPPILPPLGSVGLTAVSVALRASVGPVIVAGLDFAYNVGSYHARSAPSQLDRLFHTDRLRGLINPAPAFRSGTSRARDKNGRDLVTDPALRGYRNLFEREFGAVDRLYDAGDRGLDLGIKRIKVDAAERLLESKQAGVPGSETRARTRVASVEATLEFIDGEQARLYTLRDALTGKAKLKDLESVIDDCDYLWAHFPECAGADGKRPPLDNLAFLKRVRAEIDPFVKAFTLARSELRRSKPGD